MTDEVKTDEVKTTEGQITLRFRYELDTGETYEVPVTVGVFEEIPDLSLRALQDAGSDGTLNALANSGELFPGEPAPDAEVVD